MCKSSNKVSFYIILILLIAATLFVYGANITYTAYAEEVFIEIDAITRLNYEGERVPYQTGSFSRGVQIELLLNSPSLKVEIREDTGGKFELREYYNRAVTGGKAVVDINYDGALRVTLIAEHLDGREIKRLERNILSDNQPPPAPILDTAQLEVYRQQPFNLAYTLVNDSRSGIDPVRSRYTFTDTNGTVRIENALGAVDYNERFIAGIDANGIIRFELYDNAGNKGSYEYFYSRYGIPESPIPTVTLSQNTDFAREVIIEITWGEDYDGHPFAIKEYTLVNPAGQHRKPYTAPFSVVTEGSGTLIVYYYQDGAEKSVSITLPYIDRTPPGVETISSSFTVYCDLTSPDMPLYASVRALDSASGIKEVRFSTGETFVSDPDNLYKGNIVNKPSFKILAEDNAGNIQEYSVIGLDYDYEGIALYAEMFAELNKDDYTANGWENVLSAFRALSMDFVTEISSNALAASKRNAAAAADVGITFVTRINDIPQGLSGAMMFTIDSNTLSLKKGDNVVIHINKAGGADAEINARMDSAKTLSNMPHSYSFNLSAVNSAGNPVAIPSGGVVNIVMPIGTKDAEIYYYDGDKLTKLQSELLEDGKLSAAITSFGDFYITSTPADEVKGGLVIGGKVYSTELLLITAAIVVGGSAVAALIVVLVNKKKKKG
ncbi:MAG: hypothetical protein WC292_04120 [Clostridia bacterium]